MAKKKDEASQPDPDKQMRLRRDLADLLNLLAQRNTTNATMELRKAVIAHLSAADPPLWPPPSGGAPAEDPGPHDGE